jgi:hypothetical protein
VLVTLVSKISCQELLVALVSFCADENHMTDCSQGINGKHTHPVADEVARDRRQKEGGWKLVSLISES